MKVTSYKEKYERKKYAYTSLLKNYNELVEAFNDAKQTIINSLESLKHDCNSDLYDAGFNNGIEESIAVVEDMNVPLIFDDEKPQFILTRLEYELLKHWNKRYKYIARDKDGYLFVYKDRPFKNEDVWETFRSRGSIEKDFYDFFKFVEWTDKEPMNIEELLNNCEVIESD